MTQTDTRELPPDLASELERRFFWWEPVGNAPRSHARILAQAMNFASFDDVRRLERTLGPARLADAMREAEPGWFDERSWEFWRGRLQLASGRAVAEAPPRRSFDDRSLADTLVVSAAMPSGPVMVSFFGGISIGRINDPLQTDDSVLLVASMEDLLATKLKTILQRAEAKDYCDIAAMLSAGVSLERALGAFAKMYRSDPALALRAIGFFREGDLSTLSEADRQVLRTARDRVSEVPDVSLTVGSLAG